MALVGCLFDKRRHMADPIKIGHRSAAKFHDDARHNGLFLLFLCSL